MATISQKLSGDLKREFKKADEIWVAIGLLNKNGLDFILKTIPQTCKLNFIVGIDLPTDPKALSKLIAIKRTRIVIAKIYTETFFHPKVYIVRSGSEITAFVGSANCTTGGLDGNIEMSICTKDSTICQQLVNWFDALLPNAKFLTSNFIIEYKPKYDNRIKKRAKSKEEIDALKEKEQTQFKADIKFKEKFISELSAFRDTKDYFEQKKSRQMVIGELRDSLGYPNFKKLDLDKFFSIKELGTIDRRKTRAAIENNLLKFSKLMKYICNETMPLQSRFNMALMGELRIPSISKGFISKVLVMHDFNKYYLHNRAFTDKMEPFGLILPKGLSFGEQYELIRNLLKEIMIETRISDFATLDICIWMIDQ